MSVERNSQSSGKNRLSIMGPRGSKLEKMSDMSGKSSRNVLGFAEQKTEVDFGELLSLNMVWNKVNEESSRMMQLELAKEQQNY